VVQGGLVLKPERRSVLSRVVYLDEEECIACGMCEEICPEVFKLDEDKNVALIVKPQGGPEDLIQEAIDSCPVECIHWKE
jgi:ferredoxin